MVALCSAFDKRRPYSCSLPQLCPEVRALTQFGPRYDNLIDAERGEIPKKPFEDDRPYRSEQHRDRDSSLSLKESSVTFRRQKPEQHTVGRIADDLRCAERTVDHTGAEAVADPGAKNAAYVLDTFVSAGQTSERLTIDLVLFEEYRVQF